MMKQTQKRCPSAAAIALVVLAFSAVLVTAQRSTETMEASIDKDTLVIEVLEPVIPRSTEFNIMNFVPKSIEVGNAASTTSSTTLSNGKASKISGGAQFADEKKYKAYRYAVEFSDVDTIVNMDLYFSKTDKPFDIGASKSVRGAVDDIVVVLSVNTSAAAGSAGEIVTKWDLTWEEASAIGDFWAVRTNTFPPWGYASTCTKDACEVEQVFLLTTEFYKSDDLLEAAISVDKTDRISFSFTFDGGAPSSVAAFSIRAESGGLTGGVIPFIWAFIILIVAVLLVLGIPIWSILCYCGCCPCCTCCGCNKQTTETEIHHHTAEGSDGETMIIEENGGAASGDSDYSSEIETGKAGGGSKASAPPPVEESYYESGYYYSDEEDGKPAAAAAKPAAKPADSGSYYESGYYYSDEEAAPTSVKVAVTVNTAGGDSSSYYEGSYES